MTIKPETSVIRLERRAQAYKNAEKLPKQIGKADYIRFLKGERLTRDEAIKAKCYECVGGEDTLPCHAATCPLTLYCQWNNSENQKGQRE